MTSRRRLIELWQDFPGPRSDDAGLRIDLNWGCAVTLGSGMGRSPVLVPDRVPRNPLIGQGSDSQARRGE